MVRDSGLTNTASAILTSGTVVCLFKKKNFANFGHTTSKQEIVILFLVLFWKRAMRCP